MSLVLCPRPGLSSSSPQLSVSGPRGTLLRPDHSCQYGNSCDPSCCCPSFRIHSCCQVRLLRDLKGKGSAPEKVWRRSEPGQSSPEPGVLLYQDQRLGSVRTAAASRIKSINASIIYYHVKKAINQSIISFIKLSNNPFIMLSINQPINLINQSI